MSIIKYIFGVRLPKIFCCTLIIGKTSIGTEFIRVYTGLEFTIYKPQFSIIKDRNRDKLNNNEMCKIFIQRHANRLIHIKC